MGLGKEEGEINGGYDGRWRRSEEGESEDDGASGAGEGEGDGREEERVEMIGTWEARKPRV